MHERAKPMKRALLSLVMLTACAPSTSAAPSPSGPRAPDLTVTGHPRLWVRAADLPRLRAWATRGNPVWQALDGVADGARADMDQHKVPVGEACMDENGVQPCESYAELFAFMSLV